MALGAVFGKLGGVLKKTGAWTTKGGEWIAPRAERLGERLGTAAQRIPGVGKAVRGVQGVAPGASSASAFAGRNAHAIGAVGMGVYGYASGDGSFGERVMRGAAMGVVGGSAGRSFQRMGGMAGMKRLGLNMKGLATGTGTVQGMRGVQGPYYGVTTSFSREGDKMIRSVSGYRPEQVGPGWVRGRKWGGTSKKAATAGESRRAFSRAIGDQVKHATGVNSYNHLHSMGLGALYGMISEDVGVFEGMMGAGFAHAGARMAVGGAKRGNWGSIGTAKGIGAKAKAVARQPVIRIGAGAGMAMGGLAGMDEDSVLGVAGSALKGTLAGGGLATVGKAATFAPMATLGSLGIAGMMAGSTAEAYTTWEASGRPGMNDMEADGDLALALHKMRHGF